MLTSRIHTRDREVPSLSVKFVSAGTAACFADIVTYPLDITKVRLQIQGEAILNTSQGSVAATAGVVKYRGVCQTVGVIAKDEGFRGLYKGLVPALQRQLCFSSVRLGLYDEFKNLYLNLFYKNKRKSCDMPMTIRLLAGVTSGTMSVLLAQPTDVVKTRMQAQGTSTDRVYRNSIEAYQRIASEEGVRGLYKGLAPNIIRNIAVGVTEMVSYDITKHKLVTSGWMNDGMACHFLSAVVASFIAVAVSSPVDVVKTRYVNSRPGQYTNVISCIARTYESCGWTGFYKGCVPYFVRLCSWNTVMFITFEQLKKFLSSKHNPGTSIPRKLDPV